MVRTAAPVRTLSPGDRATIERLHAALLRKRATRLSQEAEDALRRAEALSTSIGDRENEALAQMNRAVVLQKRGRYKVAEPLYEKALRALRKQGNLAALAKTLLNYGSLLGMTGRNPLALRAYREASRAFEMNGDPLWAARLQVNMAIVLRELRRPKRALPLALAARDVIRRHGDKYWTFNAEQAVSNVRRDIRYGWHP
ncbi:MAG: tetratricopeptide repeat protein [Acidobacteriota bacterium]|nr:tetratricopeptide repeat protein [Acidobacteriota bacterium]